MNYPGCYLSRQHTLGERCLGLLALCRQNIDRKRHCYAIASPNEFGAIPLALNGSPRNRSGKQEAGGGWTSIGKGQIQPGHGK